MQIPKYLSFKGDKLHVELSEDCSRGTGTARYGCYILLGEVHAFWWTTFGPLVVPVLQGQMVSSAHADFRTDDLWLYRNLENKQHQPSRSI